MNVDPVVHTYLPTMHQKMAAAVLAVLAVCYLVNLLRRGVLREEHALLWIVALVVLSVAVFFDPVLGLISMALGTVVPASALLLLGLFFLFTISIWMTCIVSNHEKRIAKMTIDLSIQKFHLDRLREAAQRVESCEENDRVV